MSPTLDNTITLNDKGALFLSPAIIAIFVVVLVVSKKRAKKKQEERAELINAIKKSENLE